MKFTYEEFKKYLKTINKLYMLTSNFLKYYNNVIKYANSKYVYELSEDMKKLVLSGLKPNGKYTENAYALFVKDFMGLSVEDPQLYVSKLKLGIKPNVKVIMEKPRFIEFIQLVNYISKFIITKTKELNLSNINIEESDIKHKGIENLIAEIIKTSYSMVVGINNFSTGVWGLRKITPYYMKKAYENLPTNLLDSLGFTKLLSIKEYELWGFPDYFTKCILYQRHVTTPSSYYYNYYLSINGIPLLSNTLKEIQIANPIEPKTLGGAICILNEIIWRYVDLLYEMLSRWFDGSVNVEEEYIKEAWRSLSNIGWSIPEYLGKSPYERLYAEFKMVLKGSIGSSYGSPFKFLLYDDDGIISKYIQWVYKGSYERSGFDEYKLRQYILLPELFDDLMPAIFLGVVDTTLYLNDKKALMIVIRTKR